MVLFTTTASSRLLSTSFLTQMLVKTSLILSVFSTLVLAAQEYAVFNSTSFLIIPNTTWDLSYTMEISFRTCIDSGNLISLNGSLTPYSSSTVTAAQSSNSQELTLLLHNSSVVFVWSINGQHGAAYAGDGINNNKWYRSTLKFSLGSLQLNVYQNLNLLSSVTVANRTHNSYLMDKRLSGDLKIGEGFIGCLYQGLGVNFTNLSFAARDIIRDSCPLTNQRCSDGQHTDYCYMIPCQNGGNCISGVNNYTCHCPPNFNGTNCENDLAALYGCDIQPCLNQGTCIPQSRPNPHNFRCNCAEGYTGAICENLIDVCQIYPCEQGTCISSVNSYMCNCTGTGFTGVNCTEDIDECTNSSLCGGYPCFNHPGGFTCSCPRGYDGVSCKKVNECLSSPCQNGGTCIDNDSAFNCTCVPGYNGSMCEEDIDECIGNPCNLTNKKCNNLLNHYECVCMDGFSGNPCVDIDECALNVCQNNAGCTNWPGTYNCTCRPGFTGKNCSTVINLCDPNPCLNNASCLGTGDNYSCACQPGFTGRNCSNNTDECLSHQCQNYVECVDQVNSYKCVCQPGWTGEYCQTDINECVSSPCLNNAQCHDYLNYYNCTCLKGFEGLNCDININDCNGTQPCQNGGECRDGINEYFCDCTSDWMGINCTEKYDDCSSRPCMNGASCSTVQPYHNHTCACLPGFSGKNCEENIDDCIHNDCLPYQRCYDGIGNYTCKCPMGYGGDRCDEEIDECEAHPCQNGGTCSQGHGNYTCSCKQSYINLTRILGSNGLFLTGYNGTNCGNDIDECAYTDPPICQAGGICRNSPPGSFSCYCLSGGEQLHTGILCEQLRSYCDIRSPEEACQHGGTCVNIQLGFRCDCAPGFTDEFCQTDIDECASSPCQYNGTCTDRVNGYVCTCIEGITGLNCETDINDCEPDPCLHGGKCRDLINNPRFTCDCSDTGFNGTTCENNIDDCPGNQCQNGGTCVDVVKNYTCACLPGYTGSKCGVDIAECMPNPCAFDSVCLEYSNTSLYDKGDPRFVNFTYEKAAGYVCSCVAGVTGVNCSEDINECLSSPCQNNGTCHNIFKDGFICECSSGYEGTLCAQEIDECLRYTPCKNGGTCLDRVADYICVCPTPLASKQNFGGRNCTEYLKGCDGSRRCRNGNCIPKYTSNLPNPHSYDCDCYPGYTGSDCAESTDVSFRSSSSDYIKTQINTTQFDLSLRFRTTVSNANLVLWSISSTAYVAIELINGRVQVRYKDVSTIQNCSLDTLSTVNNSEYHLLNLKVTNNITLNLPLDTCHSTACSTEDCLAYLPFGRSRLPQVSQVFIGSRNLAGIQEESNSTGYVGCMEDVTVNNDLYYPGKQIGWYYVSPGCSRSPQCAKGSCSGHGFCEDLWDSYVCQCYRPYYGVECENEYQSATFGINGGTRAMYRGLAGAPDDWQLSFFIITRQDSCFVIYFGNEEFTNPGKLSFLVLYIVNGTLAGDFHKCGYTKNFDTTPQVSDGNKHFLSVDIKDTTLKVMVDAGVAFQGTVRSSEGLCNNGFGFTVFVVNIGQVLTFPVRSKRDADRSVLRKEVGFEMTEMSHQRLRRQASDSFLAQYQNMSTLQGVVQDVRVNKLKLGFTDNNFALPDTFNATVGALSTRDVCQDSPCQNGGTCADIFYNDFNCTCPQGFIGKNCNMIDHCFRATCPSESRCQNIQDGYECISTAGFNTDNSLVTYNMTGEFPEPVLTFRFRTRGLFGLIFLLRKEDYFFKVRVAVGILEMNWKLSSEFSTSVATRLKRRVDDGQWYQAKFEFINGTNIKLQLLQDNVLLDETNIVSLQASNFSIEDIMRQGEIILGSTGRQKFSYQWEAGYKGCLQEVRIGGQLLPFFKDDVFKNNMARNRFQAQRVENIVNNCDGRDACASHSCLNGGKCVDLWNDYKCECPVGLEGTVCEDNPNNCASQPCMNGGICVDGLASFTCTCSKGFSGSICENNLDLCNTNNSALCASNSTCVERTYDFICSCTDPGYTGWYCNISKSQTCSTSLCQNGGKCFDEIITIGTNTNVSSFNCTCRPGYEGPVCEKAIDYCHVNGPMCENNGTCINDPDNQSFKCQCQPDLGFTGANCSERIDNCKDRNCNNGRCENGVNSSICLCNNGFTGPSCESSIDECQNTSLCQHGSCSNGTCNCTGSGWTGDFCKPDVDECNSTEPICLHGGNCTNTEGSYNCSCTLGYGGERCEKPDCSSVNCEHEGICQANLTDWKCSCSEFTEGLLCEVAGPCYSRPCDMSKTSKCTQSFQFNNYTCICNEGWQGVNCTDDVDECLRHSVNCGHGSCNNTLGSYICTCQPGYTGRLCEKEIDECDPNPCGLGVCLDSVNNFTCNCNGTGYEGPTCSVDIDECTLNPMICNEGNCTNSPGTYNCLCEPKYLGSHCEALNPCFNTVCQNEGKCQHNLTESGSYSGYCQCASGYEGVSCEKSRSTSKSGPDLGVIIGPIVGGVVLVILVIVIIAFVMTARSKRATRGAYSPSQQETSGSRVEMDNVLKKPPEERLI